MSDEAIKKRLSRCKAKTLESLLENYKVIYSAKHPFHFLVHDPNGMKYIRVDIDTLDGSTKEMIDSFKKDCPSNTIFEARIFEKHQKKPEPIYL